MTIADTSKIYCSECGSQVQTDGMVTYINNKPICRKCSLEHRIVNFGPNTREKIPHITKTIDQIREVIRIANDGNYDINNYYANYYDGVFETLMWLIGEIPDEDFEPIKSKNT